MLPCCRIDEDSRATGANFSAVRDDAALAEDQENSLVKTALVQSQKTEDGATLAQQALLGHASRVLLDVAETLQELAREERKKHGQTDADPDGEDVVRRPSKMQGMVSVGVHLYVERILFLDNVAQQFGTQLVIRMEWELPDDEEPPKPEEDDGDWEPNWTPKYSISLLMEEVNCSRNYSVVDRDGKKWIIYMGRHLVNIFEQLELEQFPVDTQDLHIELVSVMPSAKVEWRPLKPGKEFVQINKEGFHLTEVMLAPVPYTSGLCMLETVGDTTCPALQVQIKVIRNTKFYAVNVLAVIGTITGFALTSWAAHPADLGSRLDVDQVLVLTAVAFKLVTTDMLPTVSYMTYMDKYILSCFAYLGAVTACHTILPSFFITHEQNSVLTLPPWDSYEDEEDLIKADNISFYIFVVAYILLQLFYLIVLTILKRSAIAKFMRAAEEEQQTYSGGRKSTREFKF